MALGLVGAAAAVARGEGSPPVVIATIDTLRADHVGAYGYPDPTTPCLDRLARAGTTFTAAHAHVPLTLPSHATLLTGQLPDALGLHVNGVRLERDVSTLAARLATRGYVTAAAVSSVVLESGRGLARGFASYDDVMTSALPGRAASGLVERPARDTVTAALGMVAAMAPDRPFLLWTHLYDPHSPYRPPAPFGSVARTEYAGEISYADHQLGRLLRSLARRRPVVVVASDHGEGLGQHGEAEHGIFLYEPTLHVPLVIDLPDGAWGGTIDGRLCGLVDVAATVAALAGVPVPGGRDLLTAAGPDAGGVAIESFHGAVSYGFAPLRGVMTDDLKLIEAPAPELYRWRESELVNLHARLPGRAAELRARLGAVDLAAVTRAAARGQASEPDGMRTALASLGYVAGDDARSLSAPVDPKRGIAVLDELAEASRLLDLGRVGEGRTLLEAMLARNPTNVNALSMLGVVRMRQGDLVAAQRLFEAQLAGGGQIELAHFNLATVLRRRGRLDDAARELRAAMAANGRFPEAVAGLAELLLGRAMRDEARTLLREAVGRGVISSEVEFELGVAEAASGDVEAARVAFTRCLGLDPTRHEAMANLGRIAFESGRADEAITQYERALRLDGGNVEYLATLGSLHLELRHDRGRAREYFARALAAAPGGPEAGNFRQLIESIDALDGARD